MQLLTYRYLMRLKDSGNQIRVGYHTGDVNDHQRFMELYSSNPDVLFCIREYVCSYDCDLLDKSDVVVDNRSSEDPKEVVL